ncbi:MAG TPA: hypothetical protein VGK02_00765 [Candidatus Aquicultor sp.]|jgi:PHP family Zn ribbon phosphoesterase
MRKYRIDLHNHTPLIPTDYKGDPTTSGADIVDTALAKGIDVFAVTDHVSVGFFSHVQRAAAKAQAITGRKLLVIPGSELKITWLGDEVHLITLFPPADAERLFEELMLFLGAEASERALDNLPMITIEMDPAIVIDEVSSLGGICHIAHVDRYFGNYRLMDRPIIDRLISETPIAAVEVIDISNSQMLKSRTNGVRHIHSSDSHCNDEIGRRFAEIFMHELSFEGLKDALMSPATSLEQESYAG